MLRRALITAALAVLTAAVPAAARVAPVAAISGPATIKAGTTVTLDAGSSTHDPAGHIEEYAWDLDGNGSFEESRTAPTIKATFDTPGEIAVSVRVTDDAGARSVAVGHFLIEGAPPVARIADPGTVTAGVPVTLDASGSAAPAGQLVDFTWDLDGQGFATGTGTTPSVTTTFAAPGTYTVALRVRDSATGEDTATRSIEVLAPGEAAAFSDLGGDPALGIAALDPVARRWITVGSTRHFAAINGAARRRLGAVRTRGLWVNLLSDRPARFALGVYVSRAVARRLHLRGKRVGSRVAVGYVSTQLRAAGQRPLRIVLPAKVRRALTTPVTLMVVGTATDRKGRSAAVSRAFALRR